jgi:hypothetical protein
MWDVWTLVVGTFVRGSWIGQYQRIIHGNRVGLWGGPRFHAAISESLYGDREIGRLQTASIGSTTVAGLLVLYDTSLVYREHAGRRHKFNQKGVLS